MRVYRIHGQDYPSVTTVLQIIHKPELARWRENLGTEEADEIAQEAANLGKYIHNRCKKINDEFTNRKELFAAKVKVGSWDFLPPAQSYAEWLLEHIEDVVAYEKLVFSPRFGYAGTTDLLFRFEGDPFLTVGDIKTSNNVWPDMGLQLGAYAQGLREEGYDIQRGIIIHLNKETSKLKVHEFDLKPNLSAFLSALYLFRHFGWDKRKPSSVVNVKEDENEDTGLVC